MRKHGISIAIAAVMTLPTLMVAQQASMTVLSPSDLQVASKVYHANKTEVDFGKLAKDNGGSHAVQDFGDRLKKDHEAAADKLRELVDGRGGKITEPAEVDTANNPDAKNAMAKEEELKNLKGAEFDKAFTAFMVEEHEKDIREVENMAKQVTDPALRDALNGMVPVMQEHLKIARDLSAKAGNPVHQPGNHT